MTRSAIAGICYSLSQRMKRSKSSLMNKVFDMDDRARLPWRFYGELLTRLTLG